MLDTIIQYAAQHPNQSLTAAGAIVATLTHYLKTGKFPIGRLPYRALRDILRQLRDRYYERPRPKGEPALVVETDVDTLDGILDDHHFEGAPASYQYQGEDLNRRRPAGTATHPKTGNEVDMETHARAFETVAGDKLFVLTHYEPNRYTETSNHLGSQMQTYPEGRDRLKQVLQETDVSFHDVESERAADVTVA